MSGLKHRLRHDIPIIQSSSCPSLSNSAQSPVLLSSKHAFSLRRQGCRRTSTARESPMHRARAPCPSQYKTQRQRVLRRRCQIEYDLHRQSNKRLALLTLATGPSHRRRSKPIDQQDARSERRRGLDRAQEDPGDSPGERGARCAECYP